MLSNSIATLVRVTPSPTTLAESSAVFRKLKDYGQVRSFIKAPAYLKHAGSSLYYAVIANTSPTLHSSLKFNVPVYHDLRDPKDEDPFNIRGLQDRKPYPEPVTFVCTLEQIDDQDRRKQIENALKVQNPYTEEFRTAQEKDDDLQSVLRDTKAPLPAIRGLGRLATLVEGRMTSRVAAEQQAGKRQPRRSTTEEPSQEQILEVSESTSKASTSSTKDSQKGEMPQFQLRKVDSITSYALPKKLLKRSRSRKLGSTGNSEQK